MTTVVATSLPVLKDPSMDPPRDYPPPLPSNKPRKSLPLANKELGDAFAARGNSTKLRSPSSPLRTAQLSGSSIAVSALRSTPSLNKPNTPLSDKAIRKTISIASFPQPPKVASSIPSTSSAQSGIAGSRRGSSDVPSAVPSSTSRPKRQPRLSTTPSIVSYTGSQTPSLLNGAGDGKSIPISANNRASDGSNLSPPASRSSSAQGSCSTSATTFEDTDDGPRRGRDETENPSASHRNSKGKEIKGNVIVSVRVRPDVAGQDTSRAEGEWMVDGRRSLVAYRGREGGDYHYDNVFATHDNNSKVYDSSAKRLVRRVMEGYHGTVFAYGMTGTGKTFSMQGTASSPGVIPLAITDIFSYIRETPHREFLLRVSYLEIYNEKIHDLLSTPPPGTALGAPQQEEIKLREDSKRGVYATPLKEEIVQSPTQLLRVIARGDHARRTSSTQFNARSSRSHAVVQIVVESRERAPTNASQESKRLAIGPGGVRVSTLSLIDLAGSERAAESKERRTEGAHINKSLLTLGTVIARLSGDKDKNGNPTDKDGKHLPYRDSKLTRLLQPALSGNSLVSILCTIQIGSQGTAAAPNNHTGETLNTLKFAARAKNNIVSHAKRAEEAIGTGANAGLLERYRSEIQALRGQLDNQQKSQAEKEEKQMERQAEQRHEEQMLEMQLARTALKERIEHLNRLILCSKSTGVNNAGSGTVSALGMHSRLSGGTTGEYGGSRSVRSSASQSTLGVTSNALNRNPSFGSATASQRQTTLAALDPGDDDSGCGEFNDGIASLQSQNRALQADLQDKNRYISTLEKRLLQARRSSHSRTSMGFSSLSRNGSYDDRESSAILQEKESEIADLRARLDDKDRMVTALRSSARKREMAELSPESSTAEFKRSGSTAPSEKEQSPTGPGKRASILAAHNTSPPISPPIVSLSPKGLLIPNKTDKKAKRRSVDEMSRMLDEMIRDKVESGHIVRGHGGAVRVASRGHSRAHSRRSSGSASHSQPQPRSQSAAGVAPPTVSVMPPANHNRGGNSA